MNLTQIGKNLLGISTKIDQKDRPLLRVGFLKGQPIYANHKSRNYLEAYHGWVFGCVSVIAEAMGDIDLVLKRRNAQNDYEIVEQHQVLDLLYKVNPMYTSYLLYEATSAYMSLVGEAFWWLAGPQRGKPKEIWILRPDWVTVKDAKNKIIESYAYGPSGGRKMTIPAQQMIHFKDFHPTNPYRGHGVVKAADVTIDTDNNAKDYNNKFFNNSALPKGALEFDANLMEEDYERIREEWNATHQGLDKSWQVAILEGGAKWNDIGLSQKDMDYIKGRQLTRDEIIAMFRVPKPLLAISDDVNRAAAREARAVFLENTIEPKMKRFATFLNEFLIPIYDQTGDLFFDINSPVPEDPKQSLNEKDKSVKRWRTVNEVREEEGRPPVPGGDVIEGTEMTDEDEEKMEQVNEAYRKRQLAKTRVRIPPRRSLTDFEQKVHDISKSVVNAYAKKALKGKVKTSEQEMAELIEKARVGMWRAVINRTDPRENEFRAVLNDQFFRQKDLVLQRMNTMLFSKSGTLKDEATKTVDDVLGVVDKDHGVFAEPLMNLIETYLYAEGVVRIQEVDPGAVFYMATEAIKQYLNEEGASFVTQVNNTTKEELRKAIVEGVDSGEGTDKIAERIDRVYSFATESRSERIARTEVARASNFASVEAWRQSEVVESYEWLSARDERVRDSHANADGQVRKLGKKFRVGAAHLEYPGDPAGPPEETVNCRCTLIPIIK